jgi:ElaB/YqjD/DUF883 family membrane-anchored ribosome-binding protein
MKRFARDILVVFLCFSVLLIGCSIFSPSAKEKRAEAKVTQAKENIKDTKDVLTEKGKGYLWSTDYVLSLNPQTNVYTDVAKQMSSRALIALGTPPMEEVLQLREIVDNLVSTNKALIIKGQKDLKEKDEEIVNLQTKVVDYEQILKDKEQKFVELSRENADLASTWVRLKSWFWWGVWIFVIGFILTILAQALPPPANSIAAIVAFPIGLLIKIIKGIIPSATKFAGVVSENVHNEIKSAAEQMVLSINELKTKNPVAYEETKNILKDKTDINSRAVIIDIKKENKLI